MEMLLDIVQWTIDAPLESVGILGVMYVVLFTLAAQKKFRRVAAVAIYPFGAFDALVNITAMTILMGDLPKEWLVTHRLQRYKADYTRHLPITWRQRYQLWVATLACKAMNKIDPDHC